MRAHLESQKGFAFSVETETIFSLGIATLRFTAKSFSFVSSVITTSSLPTPILTTVSTNPSQDKCVIQSDAGSSFCRNRRCHVQYKAARHHHHAKDCKRLSSIELPKGGQERADYQKADAYAGKAGHLHLLL
jgi:hypothetical protein